MEAQLKGAVLIALVVVPQWRCPILKPLSAKLPPKSETAPHSEWQNGKILGPGCRGEQRDREQRGREMEIRVEEIGNKRQEICNDVCNHKILQ